MKKMVLFLSLIVGFVFLFCVEAIKQPAFELKTKEETELDIDLANELIQEGKKNYNSQLSAVQLQIALMQLKEFEKIKKEAESKKKKKKDDEDANILETASNAFLDAAKNTTHTVVTYGIAMPICFYVWATIYKTLFWNTGIAQGVTKETVNVIKETVLLSSNVIKETVVEATVEVKNQAYEAASDVTSFFTEKVKETFTPENIAYVSSKAQESIEYAKHKAHESTETFFHELINYLDAFAGDKGFFRVPFFIIGLYEP